MASSRFFAGHMKFFTLKNTELLRSFEGEENFQLREGETSPGRCPVEGEPVYMMMEMESAYHIAHPRLLLSKAIEPWCEPGYDSQSNWTFSEYSQKMELRDKIIHESFAIRRFGFLAHLHHFLVKNLFLLLDPDSTSDFRGKPVFMHPEGSTWALIRFWPKKLYPVVDDSMDDSSFAQLQDTSIALALSRNNSTEPIPEVPDQHYIQRLLDQWLLFEQVKDNWFDSDSCDHKIASLYYEAITKNSINGLALYIMKL
jgi:hypothetical protein